jgi:acyl-CoA synthetase (AMP-forming)/AMP-acid ligase II
MFDDRPCLGWLPVKNGRLAEVVWLTYGQIYAKCLHFGSGLRSLVEQVPYRAFLPYVLWQLARGLQQQQLRQPCRALLATIGISLACVRVAQRDFIGICARNRLEWYVSDYACFFHNIVPVPIHTSFGNFCSRIDRARCVLCWR